MPPITVYVMTSAPIVAIVTGSGQPMMTESTTEGA